MVPLPQLWDLNLGVLTDIKSQKHSLSLSHSLTSSYHTPASSELYNLLVIYTVLYYTILYITLYSSHLLFSYPWRPNIPWKYKHSPPASYSGSQQPPFHPLPRRSVNSKYAQACTDTARAEAHRADASLRSSEHPLSTGERSNRSCSEMSRL